MIAIQTDFDMLTEIPKEPLKINYETVNNLNTFIIKIDLIAVRFGQQWFTEACVKRGDTGETAVDRPARCQSFEYLNCSFSTFRTDFCDNTIFVIKEHRTEFTKNQVTGTFERKLIRMQSCENT